MRTAESAIRDVTVPGPRASSGRSGGVISATAAHGNGSPGDSRSRGEANRRVCVSAGRARTPRKDVAGPFAGAARDHGSHRTAATRNRRERQWFQATMMVPRSSSNVSAIRQISTGQLSAFRYTHLHPRPINLLVLEVPYSLGGERIVNLGDGFPLRCFQRLSFGNIATQRCP